MIALSPREELLKLHQKISRQNQKIIQDSVIHEDRFFKTYEKHYLKAVSHYQKISSLSQMYKDILDSDIIFVGDYHTLNQSQRSFLRILRHLVKKNRQFVLGMEIIQTPHQLLLDRYMKGKITDQAFLKKIGFKEHWFFDLWENFKPLFDFAKYHQIPVFALESDLSQTKSLGERDQKMGERIFEIYAQNPHTKIFVFVGDLHLAPQHLPRVVDKKFSRENIKIKCLSLYQNSEAIYWKLAHQELEHQVNLVKISSQEYCRMHTPPIIVQQSYLNWLEHEEGELDFADAKKTFISYLKQIATYLAIPLGKEVEQVRVFTCGDLSFLKRLKETKAFSPKEFYEIKRQILRSESYYIPKQKIVYLANVSVNHASEEASHTLKHFCSGDEFPRPMQDAFYANILHEALGFFGSKIINPKRKCTRANEFKKLMDYLKQGVLYQKRALEYEIAKHFLEHEALIAQNKSFHANKIRALSVDLFLGLTHALGYCLGEKMFYGLLINRLTKKYCRDLFYDACEEEGDPLKRYLELNQKLKGIQLPKRA